MLFSLNLIILAIGISGIIGQTIILRELLVTFYGNELTLGVILSNWVISGALGVFTIGKLVDKLKSKINLFVSLQAFFCLYLFFAIYLCRGLKVILGIPFGQAIGLLSIFFFSFLIVLPLNFCLGGIFSSACAIAAQYSNNKVSSVTRIYGWEAFGCLAGGVILTYLLLPYFNSFEIVFFVFVLNIGIYCLFFRLLANRIFKLLSLFLVYCFFFFAAGNLDYFDSFTLKQQLSGKNVLANRNSVYGNVAVTKEGEQYTFFYNGVPAITAPYPDITFVEEFANLPLLFHSKPKKILIIGAGAGGLLNECLKHPVGQIDYAELDPLTIEMLRKFPTPLTKRELTDERVKVSNSDGRLFLKNSGNSYDVIMVGISKPADLSVNRLFTEEFFLLAKGKLNQNGIMAFWLPGSLTYMGKELIDLDACILNALNNAFSYVRVIPGDYHIVLASNSHEIMSLSAKDIADRLEQRRIKTNLLLPSYIDYRFAQKSNDWFRRTMQDAGRKINHDFRPLAVFQANLFWNKQFPSGFTRILEAAGNLNLKFVFIFILVLTVLIKIGTDSFRAKKESVPMEVAVPIIYSIFTTGFFGMFANLILIFSFQVLYGYLFYKIGLLISVFMAGVALGSIFMASQIKKIKHDLRVFVYLELCVLGFSLALTFIILALARLAHCPDTIFLGMCFIPGLLLGLEFPLAARIYLAKTVNISAAAGSIYAADLVGGWLAGLLTGIVFLPILGLFGSCLVVVMFKLSSLVLLCLKTF